MLCVVLVRYVDVSVTLEDSLQSSKVSNSSDFQTLVLLELRDSRDGAVTAVAIYVQESLSVAPLIQTTL